MYKYNEEVKEITKQIFDNYNFKESSMTFHSGRINKFFSEYMALPSNSNKPLDAITFYDINTYLNSLECSDSERTNRYSSLKLFFEYTYLTSKSKEIMSQVIKPICVRKSKEIMCDKDYEGIKQFILTRDNNLSERLILGLFLFTGLSRKYIASIRNNHFVYDNGVYKLVIWKDNEEAKLPLKAELQLLIHEYCSSVISESNLLHKVIKMDENAISSYIGQLTKRIVGKKYSPTIFSNTFISLALSNGTYIWEVSMLTLESVSTIEKHIIVSDDLVNKQTSILNSF